MPTLSRRIHALPASPIRRLAPFAEQARKRGVHVHGLNIGQPDVPTPPVFYEAIQAARPETLAYSPSEGLPEVRQKLADYYEKFDANISAEDVLVTVGGSEALWFVFLAAFDPGDEILVPEPFYANYWSMANVLGLNIVAVTCRPEDDYALPDAEAFEKRIGPRTRGLLLNNPSNPTGRVYTKEALKQLRDLAVARDFFVISDEVYNEFVYDGATFTSVLSLNGLAENAVVVDTVSKRWSACGARIGFFITRNRQLRAEVLKLAQARLSPPTLGQLGTLALLGLPDSYYAELRATYAARRDVALARLHAMPGVKCSPSRGAFYLLPELPVDDVETFLKWLLTDFEKDGQTVMLAPGSGFYATRGEGRRQARLAYVLEIPQLEKALDVLAAGLQAYPGYTG